MKKTITKQDGSTEVVEGTAEEIAEYERKMRGEIKENPAPKTGPGLLTDEVKRLLGDEWIEKVRRMSEEFSRHHFPERTALQFPRHSEFCEIVVAQRGWMSIIPPRCTCGAELTFYKTSNGTEGMWRLCETKITCS